MEIKIRQYQKSDEKACNKISSKVYKVYPTYNCNLVILINNELIGFSSGYIEDKILKIKSFIIRDEERTKGYGLQLLEHCEEIARKNNCRIIKILSPSYDAVPYYERRGYKEDGGHIGHLVKEI